MVKKKPSSAQFLCQKWTIFSVSVLIVFSCVLLAALSHRIADNYAIDYKNQFGSEYQKESLEQALIGMAVTTGFFALFGLFGSLKESTCLMTVFAVYFFVNTLINLYVTLRADGLLFYALIHLFITTLALSFTRQLRARARLEACSCSSVLVHVPQSVLLNQEVKGQEFKDWSSLSFPPPYEWTNSQKK